MKKILVFALAVTAVYSCQNSTKKSSDGEVVSSAVANNSSEAELKQSLAEIEKEEQQRLQDEQNSRTTMSFNQTTIDFGKIKEDTEHKASFVVTNTGKKPLSIDDVKTSCGCTTAQKPEKPIAPGKSDKIEIIFHPHVGQLDEQHKTVTIRANTNPAEAILNIKAFVEPK